MDVLTPLRPTSDDPDILADAIAKAEHARGKAAACVDSLERNMRAALVTADDAALDRLEREASLAHRGIERIDALIEQMRAGLPATFIRLTPPGGRAIF